jgi:arylsulfatase A
MTAPETRETDNDQRNRKKRARDRRPNIVLIVADDLGIGDLGAYGATLIRTPQLDKLAATGLLCESMYAAAAWDTASRCGMLTGRYGARYALPASSRPDTTIGLPADAVTIASLLQDAGYSTGLFGQWRLGARPGQLPLDHGFDRFHGTLYGADVAPLALYRDTTVVEADYDTAFAARDITDAAVEFIADKKDRPFFAVLSHLAPHIPYRSEPRFFGRSQAGLYGDVVEQLDHYTGVLLKALRKQRADERTLVIFTSDNGPRYEGLNQRRRGRKPELFDGGVRVPFVASWLTAGRRVRDKVPRSLLDLTPSFCALAGVTPPSDLDGTDMSPLFSGRAAPARGPVYLWSNQFLHAMRSGKWKLHVSYGNGTGLQLYMPQLFDVESDFRENYSVRNLNPTIVSDLQAQLTAVREDVLAEAASRTTGGAQ